MTPPDLLALAARVEAAGGADRELDAAIIAAIGKRKYPGDWWIGHQYIGRVYPLYTASLDAAMTLIPGKANSAGEVWRAEGYSDPGVLAPHVRASAWVAGAARVFAATPALALTAAALKASASMEDITHA